MSDSLSLTISTLIEDGDVYLFLLPIYTVLLLGERLYDAVFSKRAWDHRDAAVNLSITGLTLGLNMLIGHMLPLAVMAWVHTHLAFGSLEV